LEIDQKLKIAIYSGEIPSTTFIERLISGLSKKGHFIVLFGSLKTSVSYNNNVLIKGYKNGKILKLIYLVKYTMLLFFFRYNEKKKLDKILRLESKNSLNNKVKCYPVLWHKPDVFHVQWAKALMDWTWVTQFNIKLVLSLRGAHINYSPIADLALAKNYRENFPRVDRFHAVSKAIAKEAIKYGADTKKIKVVYSGLDLKDKQEIKYPNHENYHIISIGRAHWVKGYKYALDACKLLKDKGVKFKYTIVGIDSGVEYLYHIKDLGLLMPSVQEGIANVVLEAMALQTMVLSTDCGGMNEVISHGENGFLIPTRNPEAIANTITKIMTLSDEAQLKITNKALKTIHLF